MAPPRRIITINLHPAIDQIIDAPGLVWGGHEVRGRWLVTQPAGKALNVSRALARLNCPSLAMGFVGQADLPFFTQFLQEDAPALLTPAFTPTQAPTRRNLTLLDSSNHRDTHIRCTGFHVTPAEIAQLAENLQRYLEPRAIVVLAGSLPPGMSHPDLRALLQMIHAHQAEIVLDLSGLALGEVLRDPAAPPVLLIKPNHAELATALNAPSLPDIPPPTMLTPLLQQVRYIAVSLGARGAVLRHGPEHWLGHVPAEALSRPITSTVGCGDSFLAGLLHEYLHHPSPADMLRRALAVATANALAPRPLAFTAAETAGFRAAVRPIR